MHRFSRAVKGARQSAKRNSRYWCWKSAIPTRNCVKSAPSLPRRFSLHDALDTIAVVSLSPRPTSRCVDRKLIVWGTFADDLSGPRFATIAATQGTYDDDGVVRDTTFRPWHRGAAIIRTRGLYQGHRKRGRDDHGRELCLWDLRSLGPMGVAPTGARHPLTSLCVPCVCANGSTSHKVLETRFSRAKQDAKLNEFLEARDGVRSCSDSDDSR